MAKEFHKVYMEDEECDIEPNTFVLLEHTYNLPFIKYKCDDF